MTIRASDHQSTMGAWVGLTTLKDGKGAMKDWFYADGAKYMHSEEEVMKARPK
jgi:branched-chain amino acid transport system substrate-binding protein